MPLDTQHTPPPGPSKSSRRWLGLAGLILVGGAVALAVTGVLSRQNADAELATWTNRQAVPTVEVVAPQRGVRDQELVLPGDVEAFYQAPIYARVSGYLKMWYKDIGAQVKAGQVLAEIETPDLDQQLARAKNDLLAVQATENLADLTAKRWNSLRKSDAVSQQTADEKVGDAAAMKAQVAASQSNVDRLQALEGFKRIVAPFDGVVTARKTDIGALINAGSGTGLELFSVADIHKMRIYVHVPQTYAALLRVGMQAKLKLSQYPHELFDATLTTTSNAVNPDTLNVLVELMAENKDARLWPGTFAEVHFQLPAESDIVRIPSSALLFHHDGLQVATLGPGNKILLKTITVGRDLGTEIEVVSSLGPDDRVVNAPLDSLADGDLVHVADQTVPPHEQAAAGGQKPLSEARE